MFNTIWKNDTRLKTITYPRLDNLRHIYKSYLESVMNYYRLTNEYTKRPNELISLLTDLNIDLSLTPFELYNELNETSLYQANTLGFVTTTNENSNPLNNTIIKDMDEYIIAVDDRFDFNTPLKTMKPLTCVYTTIDNIFITHPSKYSLTINSIDFTVYKLNVPMLGLSYYYWAKEQLLLKSDIDIARFIFEVVLINVIPDISDLSLLNRFLRYKNESYSTKFINDTPITIRDFKRDFDKMFKWVIKNNKNKSITYNQYFNNIPLFYNNTLDILNLDIGYYNRRNEWVLWLSRINYIIDSLTTIDKDRNLDIINEINIQLSYSKRRNVFKLLNKDLEYYLKSKINTLEKIIKEL